MDLSRKVLVRVGEMVHADVKVVPHDDLALGQEEVNQGVGLAPEVDLGLLLLTGSIDFSKFQETK